MASSGVEHTVRVLLTVVVLQSLISGQALSREESLLVISGTRRNLDQWFKYTDSANSLYRHLSAQAFGLLGKRSEMVSKMTTRRECLKRQREVRRSLMAAVGPFPPKTPLNATVTGVVRKDGFRVEKVVYESMPGFHVTSALFIPDGLQGKAPAILFCLGHSGASFRRTAYQKMILNLVKKGFIVFAFDPIGQGERLQYFDPRTGQSRIGKATLEHSYPGAQCFICAKSVARYFIWDGVRGIDYLLSRSEVDPERIGCHGLSGGGMQSSHIAALDGRVKAVAPAGFITSLRRLFESIGPQDGEQNLYHDIRLGLDHADLLEVRAPKPALMVTTTRDFFSIQGSRETLEEVRRTYRILNRTENIAMVEDDHVHGYTSKNREAVNAFFQKHLDLPGSPRDEDVAYLEPRELKVTETGQISTSLRSETVFSINAAEAEQLLHTLGQSRRDLRRHRESSVEAARRLSGFIPPTGEAPQPVFTGRYNREGYAVEKYFLQGEGEYVIPFLLFVPQGAKRRPATIYLHHEGKAAEARRGGQIESIVKAGHVVLAPDLIGIGEMGPGIYKGDAHHFKVGDANFNVWFASVRIGRSIVGIRAGDVLRLVRYLAGRSDVRTESISAVARGDMCPVLLHAAAFEPRIAGIALIEPLVSYRSIVMNRYYRPSVILSSVAGALSGYDLPDLAACLAPRRLLFVNATDQNGEPATPALVEKDLPVVRRAYAKANAADRLEILRRESSQGVERALARWLGR